MNGTNSDTGADAGAGTRERVLATIRDELAGEEAGAIAEELAKSN